MGHCQNGLQNTFVTPGIVNSFHGMIWECSRGMNREMYPLNFFVSPQIFAPIHTKAFKIDTPSHNNVLFLIFSYIVSQINV